MNSSLTFAYEFSRDADDFGWLKADLATPDFSACNGMWVQWQDVVEFGERLEGYPIKQSEPVSCEWGFGGNGAYESITKLVIGPQGRTGGLLVQVRLANCYEPAESCQTSFTTDYPALARFRGEIAQMMRKEASAAVLTGFRRDER